MKIPIAQVQAVLEAALKKRGMNNEMAAVTARDYLEGDLQGKQSHGLMAFPSLLANNTRYEERSYVVEQKTHAALVVNANALPGMYVCEKIGDELIAMAKAEGIATGFVKNMTTWLRPGSVAEFFTDRDMVAFVVSHGGKPMVAPFGGYDSILGTNPVGIGIPTDNRPVLVDMATSKRAWGEVRKAKIDGTAVPANAYYSADGSIATQPDDAFSALPFGEYKGFALSLFIEVISGSLLGLPMSQNMSGASVEKSDAQDVTRGGMIFVIDPSFMTDPSGFKKANSSLVEKIKQSRQLNGAEEIRLPGERALVSKEKILADGFLEVDDDLWRKIQESA